MKNNKYGSKYYIYISALIVLSFFVLLFYPIIFVFKNTTLDKFLEVINTKVFIGALKNSFLFSFISTVLSMALSFIAALSIERSTIKFKNVFSFIYILPMLVPSISHSFGIVSVLGHNGFITRVLNLNINIYGAKGIVLGSIMYAFPVAFIMFRTVLKYEDVNVYNVCKIIGIDSFHQLKDITMPYLNKTFILTFFSIFSLIITDYGVPIMIGAKTITIPVLIYNKVIYSLDYSSGCTLAIFLLMPAIISFIVDIFYREKDNTEYDNSIILLENNKILSIILYFFNIIICSFILLTLSSFIFILFAKKYPINISFTFDNIIKTIKKGADIYLYNSIIISVFTGLIGTFLSFLCAYISSRISSKISKLVHVCAIISMAIPGIVLGLSYLITFKKSLIYGSIIILIVVNIFHFISYPYILAYNSLNKLNINLERVGETLGINRFYIIRDVIVPQLKNSLVEMFTYFFINSMMTISAVAFLVPPAPKPISLMINQFNDQLLIECAAFVSLMILFVNIIIKILFNFLLQKKINNI